MRSWNNASRLGGVLTLAVGAFVLEESTGYRRGTLLRMGPGFFPTMLGALLLVLGVLLLANGFRRKIDRLRTEHIKRPELRALACVLGALAVFAVTLPRYGLGPAIMLLVLIAAGASPSSRPLPALALAGSLTVFAWLIFVVLLSLPLPMLIW